MRLNGMRVLAVVALAATAWIPAVAGTVREERNVITEERFVTGKPFLVENLSGSMTVVGGGAAGRIVLEARVVADAATGEQAKNLVDSISILRREENGGLVLRAGFPLDRFVQYRPPRDEAGPLMRWVRPIVPVFRKEKLATVYDGRSVEIGNAKGGVALAVHLKVTVPSDVDATYRQVAGPLYAARLRGRTVLETIEGGIAADQVYLGLVARSGGGSIAVYSFKGDRIEVQTGSGDVEVQDVQATEAAFRSTSGDIRGSMIASNTVTVQGVSGDVSLSDVDPSSVSVETDSGTIDLATRLRRTREARIKSGSGDVVLRVGDVTPFTLAAVTSSGSVEARGVPDLLVVETGKTGARMHRGSGGATVEVATVSGGVRLLAIK